MATNLLQEMRERTLQEFRARPDLKEFFGNPRAPHAYPVFFREIITSPGFWDENVLKNSAQIPPYKWGNLRVLLERSAGGFSIDWIIPKNFEINSHLNAGGSLYISPILSDSRVGDAIIVPTIAVNWKKTFANLMGSPFENWSLDCGQSG